MPLYEFRCRTCDERFEVRRSMEESSDAATCPSGHLDTVRLLSMFASTGASVATAPSLPAAPSGGCGSGCGCHH